MIWASWVLLAIYVLSNALAIGKLNKPVTAREIVTPGTAGFAFVLCVLMLGAVNIIGWNWATLIVAADIVWTVIQAIYLIDKTPKVRRVNAWFIFNQIENIVVCVAIVVGSVIANG